MKVRILYPTVAESHGIKGLAGDEVEADDDLAKALIAEGSLEEVVPKRATKTTTKSTTKE